MDEPKLLSKRTILIALSIVIMLSTVIGVFMFAHTMKVDVTIGNPTVSVNNYLAQKGKDYWMNKDEYKLLRDIFTEYIDCQHFSDSVLNTTKDMVGEDGKIGKVLSISLESKIKDAKKHYILMDDKNKEVKGFRIKVGEVQYVSFYKNNKKLLFDLDEKVVLGKTHNYNVNYLDTFAISYIINPKIANINNGVIKGIKSGKTELKIFKDGYWFNYEVNVH